MSPGKKHQFFICSCLFILLMGCQEENEPKMKKLAIQDFAPREVTPGTIITVKGQGFSDSLNDHVVNFQNDSKVFQAGLMNLTLLDKADYLFFYVPEDISLGSYYFSINLKNDSIVSKSSINVSERPDPNGNYDYHVLQSLDTTSGQPGDTVALQGFNYKNPSEKKADYRVRIGETSAEIVKVIKRNMEITLEIEIPDLSPDHYGVQVTFANVTSENALHFQVKGS